MSALTIIIAVIDILVCIGLVFMVVFQEGNSKGLGVIGGGAETFFGKSKGRSIDALLKKLTSVTAVVFAVLTVVLYLLTGRGG
ncbi:MAG: preprotein translocase subunit SecG [Clostridia bacterium]|nr:preprotein translocase subunit SecG [Eubacteriales bacterium]MDD3866344.1 preprotein translocase subunit SecG [Eubacteriales bacterium]NCC47767.1 preprotein translocase subunit SecG [Clostridia bacterium]